MTAPWVYLAVATVFEIGFAVCMKASEGFTRPWPTAGLVVSAIGGTTCLTLALRTLPVGVAYPIWTGLGAVGTVVNLGAGQRTTTTDSSTKFIAGAKLGTTVTGESIALHRGRTTNVWQTMLRNDQGKLCAVVTQTQLIM